MRREDIEAIFPLSPAQQSMLMHLVVSSGRTDAFFEQFTCRLEGIDEGLFKQAWQQLVERHMVLRTHYMWEHRNKPVQIAMRRIEPEWRCEDWRALPEEERRQRLADDLAADSARKFELDKGPMLRFGLFREDDEIWHFVWTFSHLQVDGWSMALILAEISELYTALCERRPPSLQPVRSFRDYVVWLSKRDGQASLDYWREQLAGLSGAQRLPMDRGEEHGQGKFDERLLTVPADIQQRLVGFGREHRLTLNVLCQGAWTLLLGHYYGTKEVVYGSVASGRTPELEGVETIVGMMTSALPTRVRLDPRASLKPWLEELQMALVEQREHEHAPLTEIQRGLGLPYDVRLFENLMVFENYPVSGKVSALKMIGARLRETTHLPLMIYVIPGEPLQVRAIFERGRFRGASVDRLLGYLGHFLARLTEDPERRLGDFELPVGEEAPAPAPAAERPVHLLVAEQARRAPDAVAVETTAGDRLTYGELEERANRLAHHLRAQAVGPDVLVGLFLKRSPEMLVALLAVLKAGGAYVPLDPDYPASRLRFMVDDSNVQVLVTEEALRDNAPGGLTIVSVDGDADAINAHPGSAPDSEPALDNLAYVIYTSGSTGKPKGVGIPHRAIASYVEDARRAYAVEAEDRALQFASINFDTSAEEIYPALLAGATLVLRDDEMMVSSAVFFERLGELGITVLNLPTAFWHQLAADVGEEAPLPEGLRLVILGGEAALAERLERWQREVAGAGRETRLANTYGPTETTIVATRCDLQGMAAEAPLPIGSAIAPAVVALADRELRRVPVDVPGEVVIGGAGVARGYLGQPRLTAERFVPDPWSKEPGARLYRSGDLGCWREDGLIEFRGRTDEQVKVRGFRIEPGEVAAALTRLDAVRDAVVVARAYSTADSAEDDLRLIAYVVPAGEAPTLADLREALGETLPDYMVPAAFVLLDKLPLTPSGKVDRQALPDPQRERLTGSEVYAAPRTPIEEMLAELWSELLGVERLGVHDDFFHLGGHSLLVGRLTAELRKRLQVELPLVSVFENPTVAQLAERVEELTRGGETKALTVELPPIQRVSRDLPMPLSYPQERVWFLKQLDPESTAYNFQMTVTFRGALDVDILRGTLTEIIRRHEVFQCIFPDLDGGPVMEVVGPWEAELPMVDLSGSSPEEAEEELERLVREETKWVFDTTRLPLIRWRLVRLAPGLHVLIQVEFHFVHDGWSMGVFLHEMKEIYTAFHEGRPSPLPELEIQYGDFAAWQRKYVTGEYVDSLLKHWKNALAGMPTILDLPTDFRRLNRPSNKGQSIMMHLPDDIYHGLREFCRESGFTLYMAMVTGFYTLLYRYTGQREIAVGAGVANRRQREQEPLIGMMVNTVVLRGDLRGDVTFEELLRRVRTNTLDAFAHQDMPFERLVQEIETARDLGRNPIFQVMFSFHDAQMPHLDFAGLEARHMVRTNLSSKADLSVIIAPQAEQRVGRADTGEKHRAVVTWEWDTALFRQETIDRLIEHYHTLLRAMMADPGQRIRSATMMSESERQHLLEALNATAAPSPERGVHELFSERAAAVPDAVAVVAGRESLTYGELETRANRLAHRLLALGLKPGQLAGVAVDRSCHLPVAFLAVLKAGGAYVPIDPKFPGQRIAAILEDADAAFLLTLERLEADLPEHGGQTVLIDREDLGDLPPTPPDVDVALPSLAYVLHTSGSTGRPKGVAVSHANLVNLVVAMADGPGPEPTDTLLAVITISFDMSVFELYPSLVTGARVVIADHESIVDGEKLRALLETCGATVMQATPVTWQMLFDAGWEGQADLKALCGGEAMPPELAARMTQSCREVWNLYGPTESTVYATQHRIREDDLEAASIPIGRPVLNSQVYVLDNSMEPTPYGVPGELWLGGKSVAQGYFGQPAQTADRFRPDPFGEAGSRLYKTGDLVRHLHGGDIAYLGRLDHQVKVRGFRIELGEIETALDRHPAITRSVLVTRPDSTATQTLVAYYISEQADDGPSAVDLRSHLRETLPEYMVPAAFVSLDAFPLTPNGKVDRKALAARAVRHEAIENAVAPRNPLEEELHTLWTEVLRRDGFGVHQSFFELGGHSLLATRLAARLSKVYDMRITLLVFFENPTIVQLASLIEERRGSGGEEKITAESGVDEMMARAKDLNDDDLDALLGSMMDGGGE